MSGDFLEADTSFAEQLGFCQLHDPAARKPSPEAVIGLHVSADKKVIPSKFVEFSNRFIEIMIRSAVLILEISLPGKGHIEKALDVVGIFRVDDPFSAKNNQ